MRWLVLAFLLSGCAAPSTDLAVDPTSSSIADDHPTVTLLDAAVNWHYPDDSATSLVDGTVTLAYNAWAHTCVQDGEVYAANLPLAKRAQWDPAPAGYANITISMEWDEMAYPHEEVALAYRFSEGTQWQESPYIQKGEPFTLSPPGDLNLQGFDVWVCLGREDSRFPHHDGYNPGPFNGDLLVRMDATP